MNRPKRSAAGAGAALVLLLSSASVPVWAQPLPAPSPQQQPAQPASQPFAPDWALLAGWNVFAEKGCGKCHALRGVGGGVGPDLGRIQTGRSFFELGAAMWNHLPRMGAAMAQTGIQRPILTPAELSNLIAFLFTAQYFDEPGDPKAGGTLFAVKGCQRCHEVGGKGGRSGPGLDFLKAVGSPVLVAAAMWNHGPEMAESMRSSGIVRPTLQGKELLDIIAYISEAAREGAVATAPQIVPGTPDRGRRLFAEKRCSVCHRVGGRGGTVGPALGGRAHHLSLTAFAALMWNHGPAMWERMKARRIEVPRLTGQDMADLVAYLYVSRYFDEPGSAGRGRRLVREKGCLSCHSVRGGGGKIGADLATSKRVGSPAAVAAAMWNHSYYMEVQARKRDVPWPILTGRELADLAAYLSSTSRRAVKPKTR